MSLGRCQELELAAVRVEAEQDAVEEVQNEAVGQDLLDDGYPRCP
jgi:hypothetical protein